MWSPVARQVSPFPDPKDCSDGKPDPQSPVQPDARVVYSQISQLRLVGNEHLTQH